MDIIYTQDEYDRMNANDDSASPVDWREKGVVGPLIDHTKNTTYNGKSYTCSATYAIVSAEAVGALFARTTGQIAPLSVQQLIDCTSDI